MRRRTRLSLFLFLVAAMAAAVVLSGCSGDDELPKRTGAGADPDSTAPGQMTGPGAEGKPSTAVANAGLESASPSPGKPASPSTDLEAIRANLGDPETDSVPAPRPPVEPVRPVKQEITLGNMLDRVWGVRLPSSSAGYALEARIGPPPYTLSFADELDPDLPEVFPRELVIVVSKEEMIVNDVKVADVIERAVDDGKGKTWEVPKTEGSFRIRALTAQLQQYSGFRSTLLRAAGLPPELAEACDLATLLMDEALPYRFLAEVVLSAGHADIFRFRLATRSHDGLLSYQVITAPRLSARLVDATNLLGDTWWQSPTPQARDFEFAYVNYIATASSDNWSGECEQDLGVCVTPEVKSWEDLVERNRSGELVVTLEQIRGAARQTACQGESGAGEPPAGDPGRTSSDSDGSEAPPTAGPASGPVIPPAAEAASGPLTPPAVASPETVTDIDAGPVASVIDGEAPPIPAGTLVVEPERAGAKVPFIYLRQDGAYLVLYDMDRLEAVRSELFGPEKLDLMVSTLKEIHPGPGILHLGADLDVPIARLVEVADLLRHRCRIQSMSGRCIEQERWLASVVLFASPPDRFGLMPEPPAPPAPGVELYHPAIEPSAGVVGVCALKQVQEAAAPRLEAIRACIAPMKPVQDVTLSLRWQAAGRLDVVATDPPMPAERLRCIKAALAAPVPTREFGCEAALLIKATADPAG
jgi:hypothetical protein